jgi:hypothetical protein
MNGLVIAAGGFAPVDQHHLLQARQMQALSFAADIPLVAFGISFRRWCCSSSGSGSGALTRST